MNGQQKQKAIDEYFSIILYKKIKNIHILNEDVGKVVKNIIHIFNYFALKKISLNKIMCFLSSEIIRPHGELLIRYQ